MNQLAFSNFLTAMVDMKKSTISVFPNGFLGMEDLLLKKGKYFTPKDTIWNDEPRIIQHCFHNCYESASRKHSKWIYVEGLAATKQLPFPVYHAWLTTKEDMDLAYDPTWGYEPETIYLGIPFEISYVKRILKSIKQYGVMDNWKDRWPLYTEKELVDSVMFKTK